MKPLTFARALVALSLSWLAPAARAELPAGTQEIDLVHDGHQRYFLLHLPPQAAQGRPLPVVVNLHGGGGDPAQHERWTEMDAAADRDGYIVVYPGGFSRNAGRARMFLTWNAGGCCGPASDQNADDVGFIRRVLDETARRTPVDATRVYATGMSNGGMMTYRLARELGDRLAAIAPVSGANDVPPPATAPPMPVLHIHSVDDPRALYRGGLGPPFPFTDRRVQHPSVEAVLELWAHHDGCTGPPTAEPARTNAAGQTATRLNWPGCRAPVVLWRLTGSGHVWPGSTTRNPPKLLGAPTDVIDANREIWAFFQQHRRAEAPAIVPAAEDTASTAIADRDDDGQMPLHHGLLAMDAVGARDRTGDGQTVRMGSLGLTLNVVPWGRIRHEEHALVMTSLDVGLSARAFTTDLPAVGDQRRFYRFAASVTALRGRLPGSFFLVHLGAFVADQSQLLSSPRLHVHGAGLGATPIGDRARLLYGLGYTYDFARGLPLGFVGVSWPWADCWRLDVLLPVAARVSWRATDALSLSLGSAVAGDLYRYRAVDGSNAIRDLRITHLRLGPGARWRLFDGLSLAADAGVEGASIQDGVTSKRGGGGYLRVRLVGGAQGDNIVATGP